MRRFLTRTPEGTLIGHNSGVGWMWEVRPGAPYPTLTEALILQSLKRGKQHSGAGAAAGSQGHAAAPAVLRADLERRSSHHSFLNCKDRAKSAGTDAGDSGRPGSKETEASTAVGESSALRGPERAILEAHWGLGPAKLLQGRGGTREPCAVSSRSPQK